MKELLNNTMLIFFLIGVLISFRYLDGRARARKKFRKPKYKQFKID